MEAKFLHGQPVMVDHTPAVAVAAGQVVLSGNLTLVAHLDIAAGRKGALAMGGGVYELTADGDLAPGDKVYWNDTTNKITKTAAAGANKHFGYVLPDSDPAADGDQVLVLHRPDTTTI